MKPRLTIITASLMLIVSAIAIQIGIGLYKLYIGCPRALGDCYRPGMDVIFWPQALSMLSLYLALLVLLVTLSKRATCWIFRLIRRVTAR